MAMFVHMAMFIEDGRMFTADTTTKRLEAVIAWCRILEAGGPSVLLASDFGHLRDVCEAALDDLSDR